VEEGAVTKLNNKGKGFLENKDHFSYFILMKISVGCDWGMDIGVPDHGDEDKLQRICLALGKGVGFQHSFLLGPTQRFIKAI
jgi:hypothetical protein